MKIMVTGGAGFIGSNFITNQINKGNIILNYDKLTYAGCIESLNSVKNHPNYHFNNGDIADSDSVVRAINEFNPGAIVNFAAESHVDRSIECASDFIKTNITGTYVLLEQSLIYFNELTKDRKLVFRFLHVSTDEVFGELGNTGYFTEKTAYNPSSPYSASKAASDHLVMAWNRTFGLPTLITNCSNNYGPYQFPEKLVPLIILNALNNKTLPVYGNGENVRDWLFVLDHCKAIDLVLRKGIIGETYIIGGNSEKTNLDVVQTICNLLDDNRPRNTGSYNDLIKFVEDRPGHDFRYAIDFSKIHNKLGWSPEVNFSSGMQKTIDWYINNKHWWLNIQNKKYNQKRLGLETS